MGWNKPFGKRFSFLAWKKPPEPFHAIQWEIHFFTLFDIGQNAPKKNLNSNYIVLSEKNVFRFNFGPREVPQPEYAWKWKCMFSGWGTLRGPISNMRAFLIKYYIIAVMVVVVGVVLWWWWWWWHSTFTIALLQLSLLPPLKRLSPLPPPTLCHHHHHQQHHHKNHYLHPFHHHHHHNTTTTAMKIVIYKSVGSYSVQYSVQCTVQYFFVPHRHVKV